MVRYLIKAIIVGLLALLATLCRTKTTDRRDPRLLGEFALVVLTMLFVSERSWKHHYVTVLLPITYLVSEFFSPRVGQRGRAAIVFAWAMSFGLMASTSADIGGQFFERQGHEIAQGYGLFLWAGVVLYATVGWRVWMRRNETPPDGDLDEDGDGFAGTEQRALRGGDGPRQSGSIVLELDCPWRVMLEYRLHDRTPLHLFR